MYQPSLLRTVCIILCVGLLGGLRPVNAQSEIEIGRFVGAAENNDAATVRNLLQQQPAILNAQLSGADSMYHTALYGAAMKGNYDLAEYLLRKGADPNVKDQNGLTALHRCAFDTQMVQLLLKYHADPNARDANGSTPLYYAHRPDAVKLLIRGGANINVINRLGITPLTFYLGDQHGVDTTAYCEYPLDGEVLDLLLAQKNLNCGLGHALVEACVYGKAGLSAIMLKKGAHINDRDNHGCTVLWSTVTSGNIRNLKAFVYQGVNLNAKAANGETVLFVAVRTRNYEVTEYLLKKGMNVQATNNSGQTPLDVAMRDDQSDIVTLLKKHGAHM